VLIVVVPLSTCSVVRSEYSRVSEAGSSSGMRCVRAAMMWSLRLNSSLRSASSVSKNRMRSRSSVTNSLRDASCTVSRDASCTMVGRVLVGFRYTYTRPLSSLSCLMLPRRTRWRTASWDMPSRWAASCTVTLSMTITCTLSVRDRDGSTNFRVKRVGVRTVMYVTRRTKDMPPGTCAELRQPLVFSKITA
jgi:hypothetical protein